jgi:hypothetical protein
MTVFCMKKEMFNVIIAKFARNANIGLKVTSARFINTHVSKKECLGRLISSSSYSKVLDFRHK